MLKMMLYYIIVYIIFSYCYYINYRDGVIQYYIVLIYNKINDINNNYDISYYMDEILD